MAFVITGGCCSDASCIPACPVDCIRPHPDDPEFKTAEQLYIDPDSCIGCSACMYACPVSAIYDEHDLPQHLSEFSSFNRDFFINKPLTPRFVDASSKSPIDTIRARVAIIGSGPSACYAIEELQAVTGIEINIFERLPTPFGLVRSGVAPDHPKTKMITEHLQSLLELPQVTCYFNVEIGTHITLEELRKTHHAVIFAGGANDAKKLNIPGADLEGSNPAQDFVSWYNGHPDGAEQEFDLSGETCVIIGNGNVALDAARVLTQSQDAFTATDMAGHAIDALKGNRIREVVIAARRGPEYAACSLGELLELTQIPGVKVRTLANEVEVPATSSLSSQTLRKLGLLQNMAQSAATLGSDGPSITFRFGVTPVQLLGERKVNGIQLERTLSGPVSSEILPADLVLHAVGYRSTPQFGLPLDSGKGTVANVEGRVIDHETGQSADGLYCVGWAKRGPSGVIGSNRACSKETVQAVLEDLRSHDLIDLDRRSITALAKARQPHLVTLTGWNAIDATERERGQEHMAPRKKFTRLEPMLSAALAIQGSPDEPTSPST